MAASLEVSCEIVVGQKGMNMEVAEATALETVTRRQPVKIIAD
jgi:hypothetical protein